MSWEIARAAVDRLFSGHHRQPQITFFGGEPLLEANLLKRVVRYGSSHRPPNTHPSFRVTTNGTLLDRDLARFLFHHRVHTVISFDGYPVAQDQRAPGTAEVVGNVLAWIADDFPGFLRNHVEARITLTSANLAQLANSVEDLVDRGVRAVSISPVFTHDPGWTPGLEEDLDRQFSRLHELNAAAARAGESPPVICLRADDADQRGAARDHWMCGAVNGSRAVVDVDGIAYGCSAYVRSLMAPPKGLMVEASEHMRIGSITEPRFGEILDEQNHALRTVRTFGFKKRKWSSMRRCADCDARSGCIVCPASVGYAHSNFDHDLVPNIQCSFNFVAFRWRHRVDA